MHVKFMAIAEHNMEQRQPHFANGQFLETTCISSIQIFLSYVHVCDLKRKHDCMTMEKQRSFHCIHSTAFVMLRGKLRICC